MTLLLSFLHAIGLDCFLLQNDTLFLWLASAVTSTCNHLLAFDL